MKQSRYHLQNSLPISKLSISDVFYLSDTITVKIKHTTTSQK
jgi:hypothetical protein